MDGTRPVDHGPTSRHGPTGVAPARVTHDDPSAVDGAVAQAVAVAAALCHPVAEPVDPVEFAATVRGAVTDPLLDAKLDWPASSRSMATPTRSPSASAPAFRLRIGADRRSAAFLSHPESFTDAVTLAISLGGDTDTIVSMTGALSGALLGQTSISTVGSSAPPRRPYPRSRRQAYSVAVRASPSCHGS